MICPMMSKIKETSVRFDNKTTEYTGDLIEVYCKKDKCALWVLVYKQTLGTVYQCGLINSNL